jgi:predicted Zn-dependent protease
MLLKAVFISVISRRHPVLDSYLVRELLHVIGARKPPTGNYPVVYDERVASSLVGHLIGAINGASIVRGSSWLVKNLGEEIFPKNISIIECPLKARCSGSRPFDAEGLKTNTKNIINNGILRDLVTRFIFIKKFEPAKHW